MRLKSKIKDYYPSVLYFTAAILIFLRYSNGYYLKADSVAYFSYLPAFIFNKTLNLYQILQSCGHNSVAITQTGLIPNVWSAGAAILWLPFYLLGNLIFSLSGEPVLPFCRYESFYFTNMGSYIYGIITLILTHKVFSILKLKTHSKRILFSSLFGTSLFFYMTYGGAMSHAVSAFTVCLFIWLCLTNTKSIKPTTYLFLLGVAGGLSIIIRPTNLFYLGFLYFPVKRFFPKNLSIRQREVKLLIFFMLGMLFSTLSQMIIWQKLYGFFLSFPRTGNLSLNRFVLDEVLFSPLHGLLYWNPIILLAIISYLIPWKKTYSHLQIVSGIGFLLQFSVYSFMEGWWSWHSFGHRLITDSFTPITIGLTLPFLYSKSKNLKKVISYAYLVCATWTFGLFINVDLEIINPGLLITSKEITNAQINLITNPLSTIGSLINPNFVFWKGFFIFLILSTTTYLFRKKIKQHQFFILKSTLRITIAVFLFLTIRAAINTPTTTLTDEERAGYLLTKDQFEHTNLHARFFEVKYLVQMDREDEARRLLELTKREFYGTKAWKRWEYDSKQKILPGSLTLERVIKIPLSPS